MSERDDFMRQARLRALMEKKGKGIDPAKVEPSAGDDRLISEEAEQRVRAASLKAMELSRKASVTLGAAVKDGASSLKAKWDEKRQEREEAKRQRNTSVPSLVALPTTVEPGLDTAPGGPVVGKDEAVATKAERTQLEVEAMREEVHHAAEAAVSPEQPTNRDKGKRRLLVGAGVGLALALTGGVMVWQPWDAKVAVAPVAAKPAPVGKTSTAKVEPTRPAEEAKTAPATDVPAGQPVDVEAVSAQTDVEQSTPKADVKPEAKATAQAKAVVEKSTQEPPAKAQGTEPVVKPKPTPTPKAQPKRTNDEWQDDAMDELDQFVKDAGLE